eukprot:6495916-Heterocapsa_arctica.AAC.1
MGRAVWLRSARLPARNSSTKTKKNKMRKAREAHRSQPRRQGHQQTVVAPAARRQEAHLAEDSAAPSISRGSRYPPGRAEQC